MNIPATEPERVIDAVQVPVSTILERLGLPFLMPGYMARKPIKCISVKLKMPAHRKKLAHMAWLKMRNLLRAGSALCSRKSRATSVERKARAVLPHNSGSNLLLNDTMQPKTLKPQPWVLKGK